jgi:hypothetical protein
MLRSCLLVAAATIISRSLRHRSCGRNSRQHDCEGLDGDVPLVERSIQIGQMANAILHNSECDAGIAMIATELHLRVSLPAP